MSETKVHFGWPAELLERMEDLLGEEFRDYRESLSEEGWQALRFNMQRPAAGKRLSKHCGLQ